MVANPEQDFVLKTVESRDVHFVRFWFTDVLGNMKSFAVVPGELESAFEEGMGFDASCIEGFSAAPFPTLPPSRSCPGVPRPTPWPA